MLRRETSCTRRQARHDKLHNAKSKSWTDIMAACHAFTSLSDRLSVRHWAHAWAYANANMCSVLTSQGVMVLLMSVYDTMSLKRMVTCGACV